METRKQLTVFFILLGINALLAFVTYALLPFEQIALSLGAPPEFPQAPGWLLGLANAGIILVLYGLLGLAGFWLARRLDLPGIFRAGAGWRSWVFIPMLIGLLSGVALVIVDRVFAAASPEWDGFAHPEFPFSVIASATAGIGEEILFRLFVLSLWAFLLNLVLRRFGATGVALWIANVIAALAFAAAHLPAVMVMFNATDLGAIPPLVLGELVLLNGLIGILAGERFIRDGLVAAVGVHFWADVVWHVIWPVLGG